jgi:hypothetical protein
MQMRTPISAAIHAVVAATLMLISAELPPAQVIGPGGVLISPGPSQPNYNPGGVGPGGAIVSPGPAGRDIPLEQPGPGGIRIAPGPAGSIAAQRRSPPDSQVQYGSETLQATIVSGPNAGRHHRFRHHWRRSVHGEESSKRSRGSAALDFGPFRSICRGC